MLHPTTEQHYVRLAQWIADRAGSRPCPVFGLNGAQGSGKSTLARFLRDRLKQSHGLHAALLSLDDCYHRRETRLALAETIHPLLVTRGVPGTHDTELGRLLLQQLRVLAANQSLPMPRFSKADDDRARASSWPRMQGPVDLVIFEGWCVGTPAQDDAELSIPQNRLETEEDRDGRWRRYANDRLRTDYAEWFSQLDGVLFLEVPSFDCVWHWRWQQECETAKAQTGDGRGLLSQEQLGRFIQHYERLTRHALKVLPGLADAVLTLGADHTVTALRLASV